MALGKLETSLLCTKADYDAEINVRHDDSLNASYEGCTAALNRISLPTLLGALSGRPCSPLVTVILGLKFSIERFIKAFFDLSSL